MRCDAPIILSSAPAVLVKVLALKLIPRSNPLILMVPLLVIGPVPTTKEPIPRLTPEEVILIVPPLLLRVAAAAVKMIPDPLEPEGALLVMFKVPALVIAPPISSTVPPSDVTESVPLVSIVSVAELCPRKVRMALLLNVKVAPPFTVSVPFNLISLATPLDATVTLFPVPMNTSSAAVGTASLFQFIGEFHNPSPAPPSH